MKTDRPITVLFHVQDHDAFRAALGDALFDSLQHGTEIHGAVVTGISTEDEFARVEALENPDD